MVLEDKIVMFLSPFEYILSFILTHRKKSNEDLAARVAVG